MKTINKHFTRQKALIALFGTMLLLFMIPLSYGMYKGVKTHASVTQEIQQILLEDCQCEEVKQLYSTVGVQFSKDGISTQRADFELLNCNYTSISEEATRVLQLLNSEIVGFEKLDIVFIDLVSDESHNEMIIKNGKLIEIRTL